MIKLYLIIGIIGAFAVACYIGFNTATCSMRWSGTGYETKASLTAGCLVKQANGKYLPENKVRSE